MTRIIWRIWKSKEDGMKWPLWQPCYFQTELPQWLQFNANVNRDVLQYPRKWLIHTDEQSSAFLLWLVHNIRTRTYSQYFYQNLLKNTFFRFSNRTLIPFAKTLISIPCSSKYSKQKYVSKLGTRFSRPRKSCTYL